MCLKSLKWFTASVEDEQTSVEHEQRSVWRLVYVQNRVHVVYRSYSYFSIFSSIMTIFNQLPLNRWRMTMIDNESSESSPSDSSKPSWILYLQSWTNDVESLLLVNLSTSISTSQPVRCPDTWRYTLLSFPSQLLQNWCRATKKNYFSLPLWCGSSCCVSTCITYSRVVSQWHQPTNQPAHSSSIIVV